MDAVWKLVAIEEIKFLKARYFRLMDTKQWGPWEQLFVPDLIADFPDDQPGAPPVCGSRNFARAIEALNGNALTLHFGYTPEIEIMTPKTARGVWAMQDWIRRPTDGGSSAGGRDFSYLKGYGHYHETYVKCADGWRIATLKVTRLHIDSSAWD
jgi:hypothetical protein